MNNGLIQSTPIEKYKQDEDAEFKMLMVMPNGFRKDDPERINMFCKRMKEIRMIRNKEALDSYSGSKKPIRKERLRGQKDLARVLGVSDMAISKYESYDGSIDNNKNNQKQSTDSNDMENKSSEDKFNSQNLPREVKNNTKIKNIPMKHIRKICSFYNVTPHYILGYVDGYDDVLWLDKNGNIQYIWDESNKEARVKVLQKSMTFRPAFEVECIEEYRNLAITDNELYILINKLILTKDHKTHEICKQLLSIILDTSSFV